MRRLTVGYIPEHSYLLLFLLLMFVVCLSTYSNATQVNIAVTNNNVNTIVNSGSNLHTLKPGQHVCKRERVIQVPVKHPESYSRPIYRRFMEPCISSSTGYCSVLRVVYQTAVRHVIRLETKHQVMYTCCPGWGRIGNEYTDCLKPICDADCQHGGECVAPNKCRCPPQWSGKFCENDIDECAAQTDKCQQICINQDGAYTCGCHQGFALQSDGHTCLPCLVCSPEFKQMQSDYKQMNRRVLRLEREKTQIRKHVTKLKRSLRRCIRHKCKRQRPENNWEDRITSHWTSPTMLPTTTTNAPTTPTTTMTTTTERTTQAKTTTTTRATPTTNKPEPDSVKKTTVPITDKPLKSIEYTLNSLSEQIAILEARLEECTCHGILRHDPEETFYDTIS